MLLLNWLDNWLGYSVRRRHLDADLRALANHMTGRVLEVGNGRIKRRGRFKPPVERAEVWMYVDLERDRRPHIQADIQALPLSDRSFDTVICLEVLEYVTNPGTALNELRRVLEPGGELILAAPFLHRADTPHDYWRFTEYGLRYLLQSTGFDVIQVKAQGFAFGVALNIFKYSIYVEPGKWRRRLQGILALPLLRILWWLDGHIVRRNPLLSTFSTGYLLLARARP